MLPQYTPGQLIPFIYEHLSNEEACSLVPKLDAYYIIKTTKTSALPDSFTGRAMGNIIFINGAAKVRTLYEKRLLLMRGCVDATPQWMIELLKKRKLNKILVIRNAAFGDVTILSPALESLKKKYPNATIHFYGREDSRDVMLFNHFVDAIIDVRTTEIGQLLPMYDEVYDLVHSIECNPSADYRTALDVAHDLLMLDSPEGYRNHYKISTQEASHTSKLLFDLGVDLLENNLIVFQYEGTALARSLSPLTVYRVANSLAEAGYQVLLWSHRADLLSYQVFRCTETDTYSAQVSSSKEPSVMLVNKFGKETSHERMLVHPKVKHVLRKVDGSQMTYPDRRTKFAMCNHARHIVSVDSFISHLADALGKSSTIIFTNYHPYTRTKYYSRADVVTVDFEKELPCGPCNGLLNDCPLNKGNLPPCSLKIRADQIVDKVLGRLNGTLPAYEDMRDSGALEDAYEKEECTCKVCKSKRTMLITVKGKVPYHRCLDCFSMFANRPASTNDQKYLKHPTYAGIRNIENPNDLLNLVRSTSKFDKLPDKIYDLVRIPDEERINTYIFKDFPMIKQVSYETTEPFTDLTLMFSLFGEFETPELALDYLDSKMTIGQKIVVILNNAEHWDHSNTWAPMLQVIAGINQVIYSHEGIVRLFSKDSGVLSSRYQIIGATDVSKDVSMYCFERMS